MRARRPNSTQSRVYETIKAAERMTIKGLQEVLGLPGPKGYARISRACCELMKGGYIARVRPGTYEYAGEPKDLEYMKTQQRMMRVIRIRTRRREPFSVTRLAELSECSRYWAKRYVTFLARKGFIERVGFERVGANRARAGLYLGVEEKLNTDWPCMKRRAKTAHLDEKVAEVRRLALQVSRECDSNRAALKETIGKLWAAIGIAQKALSQI